MEPVKNLNDKRVCDISHDRRVVEIVQKGCLTRIEYSGGGKPPVRQFGNRRSGALETGILVIWKPLRQC